MANAAQDPPKDPVTEVDYWRDPTRSGQWFVSVVHASGLRTPARVRNASMRSTSAEMRSALVAHNAAAVLTDRTEAVADGTWQPAAEHGYA